MFKNRLITISALPFVTALLLGSNLMISNKPTKVSATNEISEHDDWTGVTELPKEAGDYYLTDNITLSETWIIPEGETNLCLNGFVIQANCSDDNKFSVISVGTDSTLNLYDCGDTKHDGYVDTNGLWHLDATDTHNGLTDEKDIAGGIITGGIGDFLFVEQNPRTYFCGGIDVSGTFNMYAGTITGNALDSIDTNAVGAGVHVGKGGNFTMYGGEIAYNYSNQCCGGVFVSDKDESKTISTFTMKGGSISHNGSRTGGSGVYVTGKGNFIMDGGEINNNTTSSFGGGVYGTQNSLITLNKGTISKNSATNGGGGIYLSGSSSSITMKGGRITENTSSKSGGGVMASNNTFTMTNGSIDNNEALIGGGVAITNASTTFKMFNGSITNNEANGEKNAFGGGVYVGGYITLGGTAQITGNTSNGTPNNVYLLKGKTIAPGTDDNVPTTMSIGVTLANKTGAITSTGVVDYSANFFSDDAEYGVKYNSETLGGEYLELVDAYAITNNTKEADKATNNGYIDVKETAIKDEEVSVTVYPNQGYKLSSLVYNDGTQDYDITSTKSFTMPEGAVSVTATFEEKGEQVVTIVLDEKFIYPNAPHITEKETYITSNYYEKLGDGVVTVEYKPKGADDSEYTTQVPTEYGEYTVRVSVAEGSEYQAGFATKDFVYSPQTITQVGFGNLQQPVAGEVVPEKTGGMLVNTKYSETLTWNPEISTVNEDGNKIFDCDTTYTATVTLTIKDSFADNYVFAEEPTLKGAGSGWVLSKDSTKKTVIYTKEFEPTADHSVNKISGTNATCTEDGFKDAYQCETCGLYYEDEACSELIGDETAYNEWILGDGKISASGHSMTHHEAVAPTCTKDGTVEYWTCSHEDGIYYADEQGTSTLTSIIDPKLGHDIIHHDAKAPTCTEAGWEPYDTCSRCDYSTYVEIPALGHSLSEVAGKSPTCTEDGYMVAYKCSTCEMYFTDPAGEHEIGNETAYNAWKLNEGKIQARHVVSKVSGVDPTKERSGYKEAWKCSECGQYFEDEACTILIGDETAYNAWKSTRGYLPQLPNKGLSAGAIVGICIGSFLLLLVAVYLIGYFFLYRKGKLDEKKVKVIYKILPRGKENLKENEN